MKTPKTEEAPVSLSLKIPLRLWRRLKAITVDQPGTKIGRVAVEAMERGLGAKNG